MALRIDPVFDDNDDYLRGMVVNCGDPSPGDRYRFRLKITVDGRKFEAGDEILGSEIQFGNLCSLVRLKQVERIEQPAGSGR